MSNATTTATVWRNAVAAADRAYAVADAEAAACDAAYAAANAATATPITQAVAEEILAKLMADADDGDIYTIEELPNGRFAILFADEDGPVGYL